MTPEQAHAKLVAAAAQLAPLLREIEASGLATLVVIAHIDTSAKRYDLIASTSVPDVHRLAIFEQLYGQLVPLDARRLT